MAAQLASASSRMNFQSECLTALQVVYKEEQKGVKQVLLLEDGTKFITISMQAGSANVDNIASIIARTIPGKYALLTV